MADQAAVLRALLPSLFKPSGMVFPLYIGGLALLPLCLAFDRGHHRRPRGASAAEVQGQP